MQLTITITDQRVTELLFGHLGRVSDWLHSVVGGADVNDTMSPVKVVYDLEKDAEGASNGLLDIGYSDIAQGLARMAETEAPHFGAFLEGNDDDITFDVAWQCIIFGKTIYA